MTYTALTDLVLPTSMANDIIDLSVENSKFFQSGAVSNLSEAVILPSDGTVKLPFWSDLSGNSQVAHHGVNLTINSVGQGKDMAAVLSRANAWGSEDLAAAFKGDDPISFIVNRVGPWWARELDRIAVQNVIAALSTTVSGGSMAANVTDISGLTGAAVIDDSAMIDAAGVLGDKDEDFTMVIMHSAVRRKLQKLDLVEETDSPSEEGKTLTTYRGRTVITTDRLAPATGGVYTTLLLGAGAMGFAEAPAKKPTEVWRDPSTNGGEEAFFSRRLFTMHPRGIAFNATPAGNTATDAELSSAANWKRAWTAKNIRIGALIHKIA